MLVSEKIGVLPGLEWFVDRHFFGDSWLSHLLSTLLMCWLLTPVGHVVFAFITQKTIVPLRSDRQWRSFFPGDLFLGVMVAFFIVTAGQMPDQSGAWWQSATWHSVVLGSTILVAFAMTALVDAPVMPASALYSPSKLYHNFLLYGGYGYMAVVSFVAAVATSGWSNVWYVAIGLLLGLPWVYFVLDDSSVNPENAARKQQYAHPANYKLFWLIPIRGSYE